eukprot:scaffold252000_cov66-Attheya_sp.AAC.2
MVAYLVRGATVCSLAYSMVGYVEATAPREERRPRHEDQDRGGARGTEQELLGAGNGRQAPITI